MIGHFRSDSMAMKEGNVKKRDLVRRCSRRPRTRAVFLPGSEISRVALGVILGLTPHPVHESIEGEWRNRLGKEAVFFHLLIQCHAADTEKLRSARATVA
jgi:hypothetical protein